MKLTLFSLQEYTEAIINKKSYKQKDILTQNTVS